MGDRSSTRLSPVCCTHVEAVTHDEREPMGWVIAIIFSMIILFVLPALKRVK